MQPGDEGQQSSFARVATRTHSQNCFQRMTAHDPSLFEQTSPGGLRLNPKLREAMRNRENIACIQQQTPQSLPTDFPVIPLERMGATLQTTVGESGYPSGVTAHPTVSDAGQMMHDSQLATYGVGVSQNAQYGIPQPQPVISGTDMLNGGISQPIPSTGPPYAYQSYQTDLGTSTAQNQLINSTAEKSPLQYAIKATGSHNNVQPTCSPAQATQLSALVANFASRNPLWLTSLAETQPTPVCLPSVSNMVSSRPSEANRSAVPHDPISPNEYGHNQSDGNIPTQVNVRDIPSSNCSPANTNVMYAKSDAGDMQALGNQNIRTMHHSQSIDIDNEANNMCGGVNRPVNDQPIDLVTDADEKSRLKKQLGKKEVAAREVQPSYRIPSKNDKSGPDPRKEEVIPNQTGKHKEPNQTRFVDPLSRPRRTPLGPPPRAFPTQSPHRRRSDRLANSTARRRKPNVGSSDPGKKARSQDEREDVPASGLLNETRTGSEDVPLGGLLRNTGEESTEATGYMNRSRANNKRRRQNSETDAPTKGSVDSQNREKRRTTAARPSKQRSKEHVRAKKTKKQSSTKHLTKTSMEEEKAGNEDGVKSYVKAFSEVKQQKRAACTGAPTESHGDSPLSNTVGDASESDDDDLLVDGNELSSDDEEVVSVRQSSQLRRTPRGKARITITISDSPGASQTRTLPSSRTSCTLRKKRTPVTPKAQRATQDPDSSDDEHFMNLEKRLGNTGKHVAKQKPKGKKTSKVTANPTSPVDLVSPTPAVRRSPRNAKRRSGHSSDDDFVVTPQTRGKTKRCTSNNEVVIRSGGRKQHSSKLQAEQSERTLGGMERGPIDMNEEEAKSTDDPSENEDSDAAVEFPSQEQGSQPIDLRVKVVPRRKKAGSKVFLEREFKKLSPEELGLIRLAFIKRYPSPPSNMQAQGRYEAAHGTEMTAGMVQKTWETQLKPWSKRWWDFYLDFNNKVREKKAAKPRNKDPTLKENEIKMWVEEYYREHGDAKPTIPVTASND